MSKTIDPFRTKECGDEILVKTRIHGLKHDKNPDGTTSVTYLIPSVVSDEDIVAYPKRTYEQGILVGIEKAWKIVAEAMLLDSGKVSNSKLKEIFGTTDPAIIRNMQPDVLAKVFAQHEKFLKEKGVIQVGDEVYCFANDPDDSLRDDPESYGIVLENYMYYDNIQYTVILKTGEVMTCHQEELERTGKTFDLTELLSKIAPNLEVEREERA